MKNDFDIIQWNIKQLAKEDNSREIALLLRLKDIYKKRKNENMLQQIDERLKELGV